MIVHFQFALYSQLVISREDGYASVQTTACHSDYALADLG